MFITVKGMTNLNLKQTWPKLGENKKILTTQWLVCVLLIPWWAICCTIILNLLPFLFQCVVANVSFLSLLPLYLSFCSFSLSVCLSLSISGVLLAFRWWSPEAVQVGVWPSGVHVRHRPQQEQHDVRHAGWRGLQWAVAGGVQEDHW